MAKKGTETEVQKPPSEPPEDQIPESETKAPTQDVETMIAQAKADAKREAETQYKGIQRTIAQKDKEIERLRAQSSTRPKTSADDTLLEFLKEQYGDDPRIVSLMQEKQRQKQLEWQEQQVNEHRDKLTRKIVDAGENPDDERFEAVWDAFELSTVDGRFERVDSRLERAMRKPKAAKAENKHEEEKGDDNEEIARRFLEERGYLIVETGKPSAAGGSWQDFEQRYIRGEVSHEEYAERAKKEGKFI